MSEHNNHSIIKSMEPTTEKESIFTTCCRHFHKKIEMNISMRLIFSYPYILQTFSMSKLYSIWVVARQPLHLLKSRGLVLLTVEKMMHPIHGALVMVTTRSRGLSSPREVHLSRGEGVQFNSLSSNLKFIRGGWVVGWVFFLWDG